jgi:hypothetical protein
MGDRHFGTGNRRAAGIGDLASHAGGRALREGRRGGGERECEAEGQLGQPDLIAIDHGESPE